MSGGEIIRIAGNGIEGGHQVIPGDRTPITLLPQPDSGFLIGLNSGAMRWNRHGGRWVPELAGLDIQCLLRAHDGSTWIGTANKVCFTGTPRLALESCWRQASRKTGSEVWQRIRLELFGQAAFFPATGFIESPERKSRIIGKPKVCDQGSCTPFSKIARACCGSAPQLV